MIFQKRFRYWGLPFCLCLSMTLASCAGAQPAQGQSASVHEPIKIAYTDDYALFSEEKDEFDNPIYGLMDQDGKVVLPAEYMEISISENGLLFVERHYSKLAPAEKNTFQILRPDGTQVGDNYSFIECASPGEDGIGVYREASFIEMRPVPPYVASIENEDETKLYWQLDKDGQRIEEEPYEGMEVFDDGTVTACRGGVLYETRPDGTTTQTGNEVIKTYFDGKYQVLQYFKNTHNAAYGLLDKDGKQLAPPDYSRISVLFEDRYILYRGYMQVIDGAQALLYNDEGVLLAGNSNGYGFMTAKDGGYVGVSWVGNVFEAGGEFPGDGEPVYDENGNPEPFGYYFVDRDGNRLGERYTYIDFFQNEAEEKAGSYYTTGGEHSSAPTIRNVEVALPEQAYFRVIAASGEQRKIPFNELKI